MVFSALCFTLAVPSEKLPLIALAKAALISPPLANSLGVKPPTAPLTTAAFNWGLCPDCFNSIF